jgi:peptidoglycan/xylan/chitin deacetylase (PgdA/CDA1 family)
MPVAKGNTCVTPGSARSVPVLMYHEVNQPAQAWGHLAVSPAAFREQLSYLRDSGYTTMTGGALASLLVEGRAVPDRTVVLTFDDGFEDFHRYAIPALVEHGFTATVYVTTGWVQDAGPDSAATRPGDMLSWGQVAEAVTARMEVGAHSCQHPQLDQIATGQLYNELCRSKAVLEDKLQIPVPGLAYPYGYSNKLVREIAREAGYSHGYAVRNMMTSPDSDLFRLPRLTVHHSTGLAEFRRLVEGQLALSVVRDRALTAGWSVVRRSKSALATAKGRD